jgi:hypothetical protein
MSFIGLRPLVAEKVEMSGCGELAALERIPRYEVCHKLRRAKGGA